jgi:hypothetical protein
VSYSWVLKNAVGWGFGLWLIGYVLGIVLFAVLPASIMGWVIMPIGAVITIWVLLARVRPESAASCAVLSMVWTVIAVVFDYVFIVRAFGASDYYKLDVYVYYALTFLLPPGVGLWTHAPGHRHLETSR